MENLENKKIEFFEQTERSIAHFTADGDECAALYRIGNGVARRICAAWNYCEGVPTNELENEGADAGFWGRACARLERKLDQAQEENATLRAAVKEMEMIFPSLKMLEREYPGAWIDITSGTGIATLNAYRQTLEKALEKIK